MADDSADRNSNARTPMFDDSALALSFSELISALSFALDLTEGQPMGHSLRSCMIGMRIAEEFGLTAAQKSDLYYALLLKDAGCSSNSSKLFHILASDEIRAKREVKVTDWTRVGWDSLQYALRNVRSTAPFWERIWGLAVVAASQKKTSWEMVKIRCERGASIARKIHLSENTAQAIHSLDEHWNGNGHSQGLKGEAIPLFSRIMNLAQTLDAFYSARGAEAAIKAAEVRSRTWFDPSLVKAAKSLHSRKGLFADLDGPGLKSRVVAFEPAGHKIAANDQVLDDVCEAFAEVIDAKSPYTYRHSLGVAGASVMIASYLGMDEPTIRMIRRAALLHDIGKLSVPNTILEKPGKLDSSEWEIVKKHPYYTWEILRKVTGFSVIAEVAASHHERLDGTGYFRHLNAATLSMPARILAAADIYDALSATRPYREALNIDMIMQIMRNQAPKAIDPDCVEALSGGYTPSILAPVIEAPISVTAH